MGITLQWADLPYSEGGFYDLYQAYKTPIDNTTFKVEWEKLTDQKWVKLPESTSCLFNTKNKHTSLGKALGVQRDRLRQTVQKHYGLHGRRAISIHESPARLLQD